jgi:hypothetical protein
MGALPPRFGYERVLWNEFPDYIGTGLSLMAGVKRGKSAA